MSQYQFKLQKCSRAMPFYQMTYYKEDSFFFFVVVYFETAT